MKKTRLFGAFLALMSAFSIGRAAAETATAEAIRWDLLSAELEGFAAATVGGRDGLIYDVTSTADYAAGETAIQGTLRYGIERYGKAPLWIRFTKLGSGPQQITLKRTLYLPRHLTIDGRKADVSIVTKVDWSLYQLVAGNSSRNQCAPRDSSTPLTTILAIAGSSDIILTHLKLGRENYTSPWDPTDPSAPPLDKECLGDLISIYNKPTVATLADNIWVNHVSLTKCGDGCIDITRPGRSLERFSISNSRFTETDKTMLLGSPYDVNSLSIPAGDYYFRVSLYRNLFERPNERNPRVSSAMVHAYNNVYVDWKSYIVGAEASKVFFEGNMLYPSGTSAVVNRYLQDVIYGANNAVANSANLQDSTDYFSNRNMWLSGVRYSVADPASLAGLNAAGWVPATY